MIWIVIILIIGLIALIMFVLLRSVRSIVRENEQHRNAEEFFAQFSFTDDEWDSFYRNEFIEDERGKRFNDKYAGVISIAKSNADEVGKYIQFSDRAIYLFGDGEMKSFAVNRLNLNGEGTHLLSIRLQHHSPLDKLQVNVKIDIDTTDYRVNHDLEYLVPLPLSIGADIDDILRRYGK
jgi:hypothetical protein